MTPPNGWLRILVTGVSVTAASLVLGGLTSLAQGFLPETLSPFANSISGWTIVTAAVIWFSQARWPWTPLFGALSFVALLVGYAVVSTARGFYYSPTSWLLIAIVAGPFVGLAAGWLREGDGRKVAIGTGFLAGILIGDGIRGLIVVAETTGWLYWVLVIAAGVALVADVAISRLRTTRLVGLVLLATVVATGCVVGGLFVLDLVL